ncbi:hypothetical protein Tco_0952004 [Tanacetum coccineum]|uniref:Uncharacterized protein n=1 Tax=Tanacetum coccineum TaxID=301880 RepID=A0ABQ5E1U3_9ASTR
MLSSSTLPTHLPSIIPSHRDSKDEEDEEEEEHLAPADPSAIPTGITSPHHIICFPQKPNPVHTMTDCLKLKNQNHENGGTGARGVVHALGGGETNQDHNDMEEDINA